MKRQPRILAGSALGLLMASAPLGAFPLQGGNLQQALALSGSQAVIRIQAECPEGASAEDCAQAKPNKGKSGREEKQEKSAAPREKPAQEQEQPKQAEQPPVEQPAAEQAAEPEQKPRKQRQKQAEPAQTEQPASVEKAAPASEPEQKPRQKREKQQKNAEPAKQAQPEVKPAPAETAPTEAEQPAAEPKAGTEKLRKHLKKQQGDESAPANAEPAQKPKVPEQAAPAKPAPKADQKPAQAEPEQQKPAEAAQPPAQGEKPAEQAAEPKTKKEKLREYLKKKQAGEDTAPAEAQQPGKAEQPAPKGEQPATDQKAGETPPAGEQAEGEAKPVTQPELPADTKEQALPKGEAQARPQPENAAPLPDSAKGRGERGERPRRQRPNGAAEQPQEANQDGQKPMAEQPEGEAVIVPKSDSAAQTTLEKIGKIESVEAMRGKRVDRDRWREERRKRREERRDHNDGKVVKEVGDRIVVKFGDNIYVDNRDSNVRLERHARDSYVEELPDNFTRYTIVKDNGVRVVTIRNAGGDIVRRSRIMPDNREVVLYYVPETYYDRIQGGYADAGADLPPLQLDIPANQYILDAQYAEPDDYYTYLDAPPVEPVERIYSVDEVVHSARIRDKVRRIDLDTITFDTGSAEIGEDQVNSLQGLGDAINKILKQNPAETFLIEGHTDAVGSDESNLVLSDERAQSVAEALTGVFDIPAENLTTQGYGEQYLKVDTEGGSRENRRVAVRRITPLVAPVASAE